MAQQLRVSLEPREVYTGDAFQLVVRLDAGELKSVDASFSKPAQRGRTSQFMQSINGAISHQISVAYFPQEEGTYTLQKATATTADGQTLTYTEPLTVDVKAIAPDPRVTVSTTVTPEYAYPGDTLTQTITARTPYNKRASRVDSPFMERNIWGELTPRPPRLTFDEANISDALPPIGNLKTLEPKVEGDAIVWTWQLNYKAQRSGSHNLLIPTLNDTYYINRPDGSLEPHRVHTSAAPTLYEVKKPPQENRPKGYLGAIGNAFSVQAFLSAYNVRVEDPVLLTFQIETDCDPSLLLAPTLPPLKGFRLAGEPKRDIHDGGCSFTYDLRPTEPGLLEIPALDFSYFNRTEEAYHSVATIVLPLHVIATQQALFLSTENAPSADIPPLPLLLGETSPAVTTPRTWTVIVLLLGALALMIRLLVRPLHTLGKRLMVPLARRRPTAHAKALIRAAKTPSDLAAAIRFWAGSSSLTATELRHLLPQSDAAHALVEAYYTIERALYGGTIELDTVRATLLATLDEVPRPHGKTSTSRRMGLLLLLGLVPFLCAASPNPFLREQTEVTTCAATSSEDFARATNLWLRLLAEGDNSREVLLNGTTCALFAHHPTTAHVLLAHYERLYGRDEASSHQLQLVAEQSDAPLPWTYRLLTPHFTWSLKVRTETLCLLAGLLCLLYAIPSRRLRRVRILLTIPVGILGLSVLVSWFQTATFELPPPLPEHTEVHE